MGDAASVAAQLGISHIGCDGRGDGGGAGAASAAAQLGAPHIGASEVRPVQPRTPQVGVLKIGIPVKKPWSVKVGGGLAHRVSGRGGLGPFHIWSERRTTPEHKPDINM